MTPEIQSQKSRALCELAPVIPVLVVADAAKAGGLATALVAGGLPVLEVTLRTPAALDVIREMAKVPATTFQRAPSTIGKPPMTASQVSQRGGFGAGATARSGSRSSFGG